MQKVLLLCKHQSIRASVFAIEAKPSEKLVSRAKKLYLSPNLAITERQYDIRFLLGEMSTAEDILVARSYKSGDDYRDTQDKKEVNKRRMERWGQPTHGWDVNVTRRVCPCRSFFKYAFCVHLVVCMKIRKLRVAG